MFDVLNETENWFREAITSPTSKNKHVQLGCHFEEVAEMVAELRGKDRITQSFLTQAMLAMRSLSMHLKTGSGEVEIIDPVNMLKELCDQIVTAVGVGHMQGYLMVEAMDEVNRSNWSKFVEGKPVFDENRKIIKGPDYSKANVAPFVP